MVMVLSEHFDFTHEARVDGAADDTAQRVPCPVVKPVVERVEPLVRQELGSPVIEVRVKFVDHRLISQHRKQSD